MKYFEHYASEDYVPALANKPLGVEPVFHQGVLVYKSKLGEWTELGANTHMVESSMDDYSYTAGDNQIIYTEIGKFSNIASHVRINPGNHPMQRVTLHHITYRRKLYGLGEDDADFFEWRRTHKCVIGHDT